MAGSSYETLTKTLLEVMRPENIRAAESVVKAVREAGGGDAACVKALRAAFGIKATLADAIDDRMVDATTPRRTQTVMKGAIRKGGLSKGRGSWTPTVSVEDVKKDRERASDLRKQLRQDERGIR